MRRGGEEEIFQITRSRKLDDRAEFLINELVPPESRSLLFNLDESRSGLVGIAIVASLHLTYMT